MNAGMVILGKTNLSVSGAALSKVLLLTRRAGIERIQASFDTTTERSRLMVFRASRTMPGWSAVGGQTQSAYTRGNVDLSDTGLGHSVRNSSTAVVAWLISSSRLVDRRPAQLWQSVLGIPQYPLEQIPEAP